MATASALSQGRCVYLTSGNDGFRIINMCLYLYSYKSSTVVVFFFSSKLCRGRYFGFFVISNYVRTVLKSSHETQP